MEKLRLGLEVTIYCIRTWTFTNC